MQGTKPKRKPPAYLFALGGYGLPERITLESPRGTGAGASYRFVRLFKHDFFAATGLYERVSGLGPRESGEAEREGTPESGLKSQDLVVLKVQRNHPFLGFPLGWLGRKVARREVDILRALQGIPGIPEYLGRWGEMGFVHAYVPGEPLQAAMTFTPGFFEQLRELFAAIHGRHVAYVDANKRENILMGEDGRPWLIDFQISYRARKGARANWFVRWMLRRLMRADWYHFYKHKTRLLPGGCSEEDFAAAQERGYLHRLHRMVAWPMIRARRRWLGRYELEKTK